jgi:hypothetical protein
VSILCSADSPLSPPLQASYCDAANSGSVPTAVIRRWYGYRRAVPISIASFVGQICFVGQIWFVEAVPGHLVDRR